ncbi:MAG: hypothetical protein BroJett018_22120 [Chloroflexota bacterium]|nr:hypothetical protein [Chloroflexota bacterium]NOG66111.1 hypothetical protein [Chloroflexota bacterium]GIK64418.1 MAG: hypothetical protein BroJett018_22120 [Chloroflexota bacterium]
MKYPLTEEAKTTARALVLAWEAGEIEQRTLLHAPEKIVNNRRRNFLRIGNNEYLPSSLKELSLFGLLVIENDRGSNYNVLLLQELRNAVENDFEVSDYFLTMNAVGNIIVNSTTGPVQGVGYNTGIVHQNVEQLADYMTASLGQAFLETQTDLKTAIEELRTAVGANQQSKLGKVISELGRCLQHGANTVAIVTALNAAAPFLQGLMSG